MKEKELVKLVCEYLEANGCLVFPQNSHVQHNHTRYRNGTPDILVCNDHGEFYGIECKLEKGNLTKSQEAMKEKFRSIEVKLECVSIYLVVRPSNWQRICEKFVI